MSTGTAATAAPFPPSIISSLKRYGDHAKAAYILYSQWLETGQQATEIKGKQLQPIASRGSTSDPHVGELPGLQGYTGVAAMWGYPGDVFADDAALLSAQADNSGKGSETPPSFMGCISERTGDDGVTEVVIAFRGSSCNPDWVTNLIGAVMAKNVYGPGTGCVHTGFHKLIQGLPDNPAQRFTPWMAIEAALEPYLTAHKADPDANPLPRVITTGHSLGGALATLAAVDVATKILTPGAGPAYQVDCQDYTQRLLQTYTFAAPHVGDAELCSYLTQHLHYTAVQVKNKTDAVPMVPPTGVKAMPAILHNIRTMLTPMAGDVPATASNVAAAAATAAVKPAGVGTDPLTAYSVLLNNSKEFDTFKAMQSHISKLQQQLESQKDAAAEVLEPLLLKPRGVTLPDGVTLLSLAQLVDINKDLIEYNSELVFTLKTHWADSPAPKFGTCWINADESGRWGGRDHSLEVYCSKLDSCFSDP